MFHFCIANRDNLSIVFGLLAYYISAPNFACPSVWFLRYCARACTGALESLHMLHPAAISRLRKRSTLMITIQIKLRRGRIEYFLLISQLHIRAHNAARAAPRNTAGARRALWGKPGGTEVPTDSYRAPLLRNYVIDNN